MGRRGGVLTAALSLCLAAVLCLALYQADNKYTRPGAQPINGLLALSAAELEADPLRYLVREWEYHPGQLLTPETAARADGYRRYLSIGQTSDLESGSGHGCGTYRLTLLLPETEAAYALELPEVFSAYRLYIGGRPVLQMGVPERAGYRPALASRVVSFTAAGPTELLLAVADYSGVYSGLTYPPAFGTVQAVLSAREGRLLLHGAGMILALLGGAMALCFGLKNRSRRGLLGLLASLCTAFTVGYPVLHGLCVTGYQPWYTLELASFYGLLLLAVLIQCDLYGLWGRRVLLLAAPCALGLLAAVLRAGGAAFWSPAVGGLFSALSVLLKYYAALCSTALSAWALWRRKRFSAPLLSASLALSACLVLDRLLPLYEPVYGGWFGELGVIVLIFSLALAFWLDAMDAFRFRLSYEADYRQMERQVSLQKVHYQQLSEQVAMARESAHDLRHHMRAMRTMAERGQTAQLLDYLEAYEPHMLEREVTTFSDHPTADAVLCHYAAAAKGLGAVFDVRLPLTADLDFPSDELCILLGNLLENAMEALGREPTGHRRLYLRGNASDGQLRLVVENSFGGRLLERDGHYPSTKHSGSGLGLRSVRTIAEKHGGLADFSADGTTFRALLMIPLPARTPDAQRQTVS